MKVSLTGNWCHLGLDEDAWPFQLKQKMTQEFKIIMICLNVMGPISMSTFFLG